MISSKFGPQQTLDPRPSNVHRDVADPEQDNTRKASTELEGSASPGLSLSHAF